MNPARTAARRTLTATLAVLAVLASLVVTAQPAAAAVTAPNAAVSHPVLYRGQPFTVSYGDIFCDGAPSFFDRIEVGVAGAGQTSIYTGITEQSSLHVPTHAPIGTNSVLGVVSSGPCTGQIVHFATIEVLPMAIDVTVSADAARYRPTGTATITATITATGNPGHNLDGLTARFLRDGQPIGTAPIAGGTAVLHGAPLGEPGWHHLEVHVADWIVGSLTRTPYEVVAIPVTLTATGSTSVPAGTPTTFTVTATTPEGTPNLAGLTATIDGTPVAVDVDGTTASIAVAADELAVGSHILAVTLPATGDFEAAWATFGFDVERHAATLHATIPGPVTYGAPFEISVQVTSVPGEPLDGTMSTTIASNTVTAPVDADGSATITVPAGVAAQLHTGPHTFPVTYDGGSYHQPDTATTSTTIGVAPTDIEVTFDSTTAGAPTTATIRVSAEHGTPDGYVSLNLGGTNYGGTMALTGGTATATIPAPTAGTHTLTATYWGTGGTRYDWSEATTQVTFTKSATATTVAADITAAPTATRTTGWVASVCTTVVDPAVTAAPADGTELEVSVLRDGGPYAAFTVEADGADGCFGAEFTSDYPAGEYTVTTTYPGDEHLAPSSGTATFTVEHATTAMALTVDADTATPRAGTVFTATLSAPGASHTHTGTVALVVNGDPVGTATVDPVTNTATFTVPLDAGTAVVEATYSGDEYHAASSDSVTVAVDQLISKLEVTVTPPTVTLGETSTFTAEVTTTAAPIAGITAAGPLSARAVAASHPTGTVTFLVNGNPVGTAALADGIAAIDYTFTAPGSYSVTATYSGDANTAPAASAGPAGTATVIAAPAPNPPQTPPMEIPAPAGDATAGTAYGRRGAEGMAYTGADTSTLLSLGAVLLVAGIAVVNVNDRRRRRR